MLDLDAIRQRAATRVSVATPANAANWLTPTGPAPTAAISQLAALATVASDFQAQVLADTITAACAARGDDEANRVALIDECQALPPAMQQDIREHFAEVARIWEKFK